MKEMPERRVPCNKKLHGGFLVIKNYMEMVGVDECWRSATVARGEDAGEGAMGNFILRRPNASSML